MNDPRLKQILKTLESISPLVSQNKTLERKKQDELDLILEKVDAAAQKLKQLEQKVAAFETKASSCPAQQIYEMLDSSFWGADLIQNKMTYVSPGTEKVYGYSQEVFLSNPNLWSDVILEEDKHIQEVIYSEINQGKATTCEYRIKHKDGSIKWIEARISPTSDENGNLIRLDGITIDISNRKQTEEKLSKINERFELVLKATDDAIWDWNLISGKVFRSKEGLKKVYGYDENGPIESIDKWKNQIHPEDLNKVEMLIQEIFQSVDKETFSCEYRYIKPDNTYVHVFDRGYIIRDEQGKPIRMIGAAQDITEQIRTKNTILETEKRWKSLLRAVPNVVLTINKQFEITFINQVTEDFSNSEVLGLTVFSFVPPEEYENIKQIYKQIFETGETMQYEIIGYDGEQNKRWYRNTAAILNHVDAEKEIIIVTDDITDRKKREMELKQNEERLDLALEGANDGLWDWNLITNEVYFSPRWTNMVGYDVHELEGHVNSWQKLLHKDDQEGISKILDSYLKGKIPEYKVEFRMHHKKGHVVHILARGQALKDSKGKFYRMIGTHLDITEEKKAKEALSISEERFDLALEGANDGLWDWNIITDKIYYSPRWKSMIGYEVHEIEDHIDFWKKLIHPDDKQKVTKAIESYLKGKTKNYKVEFRLRHKKGHYIDILSRAQALRDEKGKPYRMIGTHLDITEQKKNERLIAQSLNELKLLDQINKASLNNVTRIELAHITLEAFGNLIPISSSRFYLYKESNNSLILLENTINPEIAKQINDKIGIRTDQLAPSIKEDSYFKQVIKNKKMIALTKPQEILKVLMDHTDDVRLKKNSKWTKKFVDIKSFLLVPIVSNNKILGVMTHTLNIVLNDEQFHQIERFNIQITAALAKMSVEDEVLKSNERYQALIENLNDAIIVDDIHGKIIYANHRFIDLFGFKREEISNLVLEDYISPEYREILRDRHNRRIAGEDVPDLFEYEGLLKNGSKKWFEVRVSKVVERGEIKGTQSAIRDITERKNAEEHLRKSEIDLKQAQKIAKIGSWEWDIQKNRMDWSDQMYEILEINQSEKQTDMKPLLKYVHPEDLEYVTNIRNRVVLEKKHIPMEYRIISGKGNLKYILEEGSEVLDEYGHLTHLFGILQDITERKIIENKLLKLNEDLQLHSKELAMSNAELEQFAFVASHDLQEPLRMITSFLSLLEKKYDNILDEKGKKYIHFATDGAKRMRHIILSLLEYSRVGKLDEHKEKVDIQDIIKEIIILNRKKIDEKKAHIHWGKLPKLFADKVPLQQVFQNLIGNALKYQIPGSSPEINIEATQTETEWIFSIQDNGIGIEQEYFEKIFTIFQRLHNKDEYSGTGIGLAICKKIIDNQGGRIWLESEKDKGTTFYFTVLK